MTCLPPRTFTHKLDYLALLELRGIVYRFFEGATGLFDIELPKLEGIEYIIDWSSSKDHKLLAKPKVYDPRVIGPDDQILRFGLGRAKLLDWKRV